MDTPGEHTLIERRWKPAVASAATANAARSAAPSGAPADPAAARIMIVDDEPINIKVAAKYLQGAGYRNFLTTSDAPVAFDMMKRQRPDVVLLDVMMPQVSGLEILERIRADEDLKHVPVIILTASSDPQTKLSALDLGATDFLNKPVDPNDLLPRIRNALVVKAYQDHLANYSAKLEYEVRRRTAELDASRREVIRCLAQAAEYRDDTTGHHIVRVGRFAGIIARGLGFSREGAELLEQAAQLHDVGKIGISDAILLKEGKLADEEFDQMRQHCEFGRAIIQPSPLDAPRPSDPGHDAWRRLDLDRSPILTMAAKIAFTHHEKWDGSGYPQGLAGEDIPIEGRITALADVFDALSTKRPYKPAFERAVALRMMEEGRGTHFDPRILDVFLAQMDQIVLVQEKLADSD